MQIECPSCSATNSVNVPGKVVCGECKKPLEGHSYRTSKKPLVSATTALVIGAVGAYQVDKTFFDTHRYPVQFEYELIDLCVNSSRALRGFDAQVEKTNICICALNETMKQMSFREAQKSESELLTRFRKATSTCR